MVQTIDSLFSRDECAEMILDLEKSEIFAKNVDLKFQISTLEENLIDRNNKKIIYRCEELSVDIWNRFSISLTEKFSFKGINSNFRFYKYFCR